MNCQEIRNLIRESVEAGEAMNEALKAHCAACDSCRAAWEELFQLKHWLQALPHHTAPRELDVAIRVEQSKRASFGFGDRLRMAFENFMRPLALPAATGVGVAVLCFAFLFPSLWMRPALRGSEGDVQLSVRTAPRTRPNPLLPIAADINGNFPDEPILVETRIDPRGRVYDYKVLSGPDSPLVIQSLERVLYFTVFDPATSFGRPTDGKAILSFRTVRVLG